MSTGINQGLQRAGGLRGPTRPQASALTGRHEKSHSRAQAQGVAGLGCELRKLGRKGPRGHSGSVECGGAGKSQTRSLLRVLSTETSPCVNTEEELRIQNSSQTALIACFVFMCLQLCGAFVFLLFHSFPSFLFLFFFSCTMYRGGVCGCEKENKN